MAAVRLPLSLMVALLNLTLLFSVLTSAERVEPEWKKAWDELIKYEYNFSNNVNPSPQEVFKTLNELAARFKQEKSISNDINRGLKERVAELLKTANMDKEQCTADHIRYIIDHLKSHDHTYPLRRFVKHYGPNFLRMCAESGSKIDATDELLRDYRIPHRNNNERKIDPVIKKSVSRPTEPEKKLPHKRRGLFSCLGGKCGA